MAILKNIALIFLRLKNYCLTETPVDICAQQINKLLIIKKPDQNVLLEIDP